jgi:hypothetical protein
MVFLRYKKKNLIKVSQGISSRKTNKKSLQQSAEGWTPPFGYCNNTTKIRKKSIGLFLIFHFKISDLLGE